MWKTPSGQAAAFGLTNVFLDIISQNKRSNTGTTSEGERELLVEAIQGGDPDLVQMLLNRGIDPTVG